MEDISISIEEIDSLVAQFSNKSLPKAEWTHQAHIIVALWHNTHYPFEEALALVRSKIKSYNLSVGTLNTDDAGYHETLTVFWMTITKAFIQAYPSWSLDQVCSQFLQTAYASKNFPFEFYSKELLFTKKARKNWVEGNLKKLASFSKTILMEKPNNN